MVEVEGVVLRVTPRAYLIQVEMVDGVESDCNELWVPKSLNDDPTEWEESEDAMLRLPRWWAVQNDLL